MVAKWFAYCREVCVEALRLDGEYAAEKIGGEGKTVENWGPHSADRESVEGPEKADVTRRGPKE